MTTEEIINILKFMKTNKAIGPRGLPIEVVVYSRIIELKF